MVLNKPMLDVLLFIFTLSCSRTRCIIFKGIISEIWNVFVIIRELYGSFIQVHPHYYEWMNQRKEQQTNNLEVDNTAKFQPDSYLF